MSRVDVPTLRCDKCEIKTQDLAEMGRFQTIRYSHMSGESEWDLCPSCWTLFRKFLGAL